ncbi:MAG: transposase [Candidatus Paceibacterota bacterium]|jgi:putative transposase
MPSKQPEFINGEVYHIYNRGVDKRVVFSNDSDHFRFIASLLEFNKKEPVKIRYCKNRFGLAEHPESEYTGETRVEKLVEVLAFCLMPNHYHLILRQITDGGISLYMQKNGNGYTGYFNKKYGREGMGSLFQGKFKAVHVAENDQLLNLVIYVLTNPISIFEPGWKEKGSSSASEAINFLNSYRWSSYLDYIGVNNFPSVIDKEFLLNVFEGADFLENKESDVDLKNIKKAVEGWILYKSKADDGSNEITDLLLE